MLIPSDGCKKIAAFPCQERQLKVWHIQLRTNEDVLFAISHVRKSKIVTSDLGEFFYWLVERFVQKSRKSWKYYSSIEDMKAEALLFMVKHADKFDPNKSMNPIPYFLQVVENSFIVFMEKQRKQRKIEDSLNYFYEHEGNTDIYESPFLK